MSHEPLFKLGGYYATFPHKVFNKASLTPILKAGFHGDEVPQQRFGTNLTMDMKRQGRQMYID